MLYTVRDDCAADLEGTLRAVAASGYEGVELHDLHGNEPARVASLLRELGLAAVARHASLEAVESELDRLAAEARLLRWRRLVVAWLDPATLGDRALPGRLGRAAAAARRHGLELGFHNHDAELRPDPAGRTFLDGLPSELFLELDLGWAWYAGADPHSLLDRARGRCPLVHVKDMAGRNRPSFRPVGDGDVGYETVAPAAVRAGADWLLVEQDEADGPALAAAERSLRALESMLAAA